jgi:hypothetical protein
MGFAEGSRYKDTSRPSPTAREAPSIYSLVAAILVLVFFGLSIAELTSTTSPSAILLASAAASTELDALCTPYDYTCSYPDMDKQGRQCGQGLKVANAQVRAHCVQEYKAKADEILNADGQWASPQLPPGEGIYAHADQSSMPASDQQISLSPSQQPSSNDDFSDHCGTCMAWSIQTFPMQSAPLSDTDNSLFPQENFGGSNNTSEPSNDISLLFSPQPIAEQIVPLEQGLISNGPPANQTSLEPQYGPSGSYELTSNEVQTIIPSAESGGQETLQQNQFSADTFQAPGSFQGTVPVGSAGQPWYSPSSIASFFSYLFSRL